MSLRETGQLLNQCNRMLYGTTEMKSASTNIDWFFQDLWLNKGKKALTYI